MSVCDNFLRKWRAKGHGVHSPFAFKLITEVLRSPYAYYAYSDIENFLSSNNINPDYISEFNRLSFRLVNHFKPNTILEIGSGEGVNSLFLTSANSAASLSCVEPDAAKVSIAKKVLTDYSSNSIAFSDNFNENNLANFDAIFIDSTCKQIPDKETLFALSNDASFWVFHAVRKSSIKPLVRNIVKDKRVRVVFDMKQTLILFLNPEYHKTAYYI